MEDQLRGRTAAAIDWEATFDGTRWYSLPKILRLTTYPAFDAFTASDLFESFADEQWKHANRIFDVLLVGVERIFRCSRRRPQTRIRTVIPPHLDLPCFSNISTRQYPQI
jgi:hypothetical protein